MTQSEQNLEILRYAVQMGISFALAKNAFPAPHRTYYFVNTVCDWYNQGNFKPQTAVIADKHPFEWVRHLNNIAPEGNTTLLSWQEITQEEYELYNKLEEQNDLDNGSTEG